MHLVHTKVSLTFANAACPYNNKVLFRASMDVVSPCQIVWTDQKNVKALLALTKGLHEHVGQEQMSQGEAED